MLYLRSYVDQLFSHNNLGLVLFCRFPHVWPLTTVEARPLAKWATKPRFMWLFIKHVLCSGSILSALPCIKSIWFYPKLFEVGIIIGLILSKS